MKTYAQLVLCALVALNFSHAQTQPAGWVVSYILQADGNSRALADGGEIQFNPVSRGSSATATIVFGNRSTQAAEVSAVSLHGADFTVQGLALLPARVEPGRDFTFTVRFSPQQLGASQGRLNVILKNESRTFQLSGNGTGSVFTYQVAEGERTTNVQPLQPVSLGDVQVGSRRNMTVLVRNSGNVEGRIQTASITGDGFRIVDSPQLPLTVPVNFTSAIGIQFTAAQPGRISGRLRINDDAVDFAGNVLGPQLTYSVVSSSTATPVQPGGTLTFAPARVGQTSALRLHIQNTGTSPAAIASIGTDGGSGSFLAELPSLPLELEPGGSATVALTFAPVSTGVVNGTLRVDTQSFALSGIGNAPAPIPDFRIAAPEGKVQPMEQPAVSLSLAEPYTIALRGVLTLSFTSAVFSTDPALQFATGGRTVNFTIPAGSTQAVFSNGQPQVRFQTGTVAGTIALTPAFATSSGLNLTPQSVRETSMVLDPGAPRILQVAIASQSASSMNVTVTGFATSRSVRTLDFEFVPANGVQVSSTRVSVPVEPAFASWYGSTSSQQFGSLFTATIPFTFAGGSGAGNVIEAVTVTASNQHGTSEAGKASVK